MSGGARRNADPGLIAALAAGGTVEAAAKHAGVSTATAHRRLADPDFRRRVAEAQNEAVARAVARLAATSTLAADTLRALLTAESEQVRLGAARAVLDLGARLREQLDLAERIAAIEAELGRNNPTAKGSTRWAS